MYVFISAFFHIVKLLILYNFCIHLEYSVTPDHSVCVSLARSDCNIWIKKLEHLN